MDPLGLGRIPQQQSQQWPVYYLLSQIQSQQWPVYYLLSQIQSHDNRRIGHLHIRRRTFMKFCFKVWSQIVECFMTFFFLSKSRDWEKRMPREQDSLDACPEIRLHWMLAQRLGFTTVPFSNPEIGKKDYAPNMSMTTCFDFLCMPTD
jgi:hypothetical protein